MQTVKTPWQHISEAFSETLLTQAPGPHQEKMYLFMNGDPSIGEQDRVLSDAYTLKEWEQLMNLPGLLELWANGNHRALEDCLQEHCHLSLQDPERRLPMLQHLLQKRGELIRSDQNPELFFLSKYGMRVSPAYPLTEWTCFALSSKARAVLQDPFGGPLDALQEQMVDALQVESEDLLEAALGLVDRGARVVAVVDREDPFGWFMDLVALGNGRFHGLLYGEFDPEERSFASVGEVLEVFRAARVLHP